MIVNDQLVACTDSFTVMSIMLSQSALQYGQFSMIDVQELDASTIFPHVAISVYRDHVTGLSWVAEYEGEDQLTAIAIWRT
jgi:hypothetical protein